MKFKICFENMRLFFKFYGENNVEEIVLLIVTCYILIYIYKEQQLIHEYSMS
jgi:hypothetical protein